jgi:hypothetical protein
LPGEDDIPKSRHSPAQNESGDVMRNNQRHYLTKLLISAGIYLLMTFPLIASAAQVTLQWDANDPAPSGYRLYQRIAGQAYDYTAPKWSGTQTTCTVSDLSDGTTYYYVVRAYQGTDESGDSNEVTYAPGTPAPAPSSDTDGDGVSNSVDAFPNDASEWVDTDGDGIGNNGDSDDDGDAMSDIWETQYGLNPLVDDADEDLDGDGTTNAEEFAVNSDPSQVAGNPAPETPLLIAPSDEADSVDVTPLLLTGDFADADNGTHARTCYQISTTEDFSALVYERTTALHLTQLQISNLILEPETTYYWRVKFFDNHNGASQWSEVFSFTTESGESVGDLNGNGILDDQEMESGVDLDDDGTSDAVQSGLEGVNTPDRFNPQMAVKRSGSNIQIVGMRALATDDFAAQGDQPETLTGLISFKLLLLDDTTAATVIVYFSQPAPADAHWYKYDPDQGWEEYPHAEFSADRMSVILLLEDGGIGDEDGVQNGIIVDPSGLGYSSSQESDGASYQPQEAAASGCFIGATLNDGNITSTQSRTAAAWIAGALALMLVIRRYRYAWVTGNQK